MNLTTAATRNLMRAAHRILREDVEAEREAATERIYARMMDIEAAKIVAEIQTILNGNEAASDKLEALADLILSYADQEDEDTTRVTLRPTTSGVAR